MHPEEYITLVFALRAHHRVTTGQDEGQNVLVGNLEVTRFALWLVWRTDSARCPYIDCQLSRGALMTAPELCSREQIYQKR